MHGSMPFYIGDLQIHAFWYSQGVLGSTSMDIKGQLKFWGNQKLYADLTTREVSTLNPCVVQGQRYSYLLIYEYRFMGRISKKMITLDGSRERNQMLGDGSERRIFITNLLSY